MLGRVKSTLQKKHTSQPDPQKVVNVVNPEWYGIGMTLSSKSISIALDQ